MSSRKIYYIKKRTWRPKKTCSFELDEDGLPLNEMAWGQTEESPSAEGGPQRDSWWTRMLSVILIIAFSGVMILTTLPLQHIPLIDLAVQSLHIKENMNQTLINAVVKIEVIAPNAKGSLGVYQKNGSGFNISPEGIIVTNYHVIENGLNITVKFPNGQIFSAKEWRGNQEYDLAVLMLEQKGLPYVETNDTLPAEGEPVKILGNPLGFENIAVTGTVGPRIRVKDHKGTVLSLNADIYSGNSGSPVYNEAGEVVAVVFAVLNRENEEKPLGLAIPITYVMDL